MLYTSTISFCIFYTGKVTSGERTQSATFEDFIDRVHNNSNQSRSTFLTISLMNSSLHIQLTMLFSAPCTFFSIINIISRIFSIINIIIVEPFISEPSLSVYCNIRKFYYLNVVFSSNRYLSCTESFYVHCYMYEMFFYNCKKKLLLYRIQNFSEKQY